MRADVYLTERGDFESRAKARAAIEAGGVTVNGRVLTKASQKIPEGADVQAVAAFEWVCRAGIKLDHAINAFDVDVSGKTALDIGASTGGFTEVLLTRGAAHVFAVDVGSDQLHHSLRGHPKVTSLEQTDARHLTGDDITDPPSVLVCDASFIGLSKVLERPLGLLTEQAEIMTLIKPQFEVGRDYLGRGGLVNSQWAVMGAAAQIVDWMTVKGFTVKAIMRSPIAGGSGNTEYLLHARRG